MKEMKIEIISAEVEDEVMKILFEGTKDLLVALSALIIDKKFEHPGNCGVACARVVFKMLEFLEKEFINDEFHGKILVSFISMFAALLSKHGIDFHGVTEADAQDVQNAQTKEKQKSEKLFMAKLSVE